jgi:3-dehydroquinate dehydratase II
MKKIYVIHGPNLNLLGTREKNIYGDQTLAELNAHLKNMATQHSLAIEFMQSNIEGELVNYIQQAENNCDCMIVNAGGYTHTSVTIRDALLAVNIPFIEVHLSNLDKREEFRKQSLLSDIASGVIFGFGVLGYELALLGAMKIVSEIQ